MFAELLFIIKVIVFVFVGVNVLFFLFLAPVFNDPVVLILVGFFIFVGVLILAKMDNHSENKKREKANLKKKKAERQNEILESVFDKKGMSTRLKEFVLQHTKKYDNNQINQNDYLDRIDMFLIYINNKNSCIQDNTGCRVENENITINRKSIVKFINSRKLQIYSDDMKNILNIKDTNDLDDVIKIFVDTFGEKCLLESNIEVLSEALGQDYIDVLDRVNKEYTKVKKEYQIRKIEGELFNSHASLKDMEYIDTLSGFEFEDFLEELFSDFGYATKDLPYSNDYGADLIISKGFNEIVIQAKNYSTNVGNKAVQEVIAAKSHYKCDTGMVITNAYYTQNAIKTAEASEIILVDRTGLERILSEGSIYFNSLVS